MTANQIAWAGLQEENRHNVASEGEITRHNKAAEDLENQMNAIRDRANSITESYNTAKLRIDEDYNTKYLALQQAQGDKKIAIQGELAKLEQEKVYNEKAYRDSMVTLENQANDIRDNTVKESERHNKEMETIQRTYNFFNFALENKKTEYQNTYWREQNAIARVATSDKFILGSQELAIKRDQLNFQYADLDARRLNYLYQNQKLENEKRLLDLDIWWYNWKAGPGSLIDGSLRLFRNGNVR